MSSAPARYLPTLGRVFRAIAWAVLFAVLAAGGAGLVAQASRAPGSPARAELTYPGDAALDARLDAATEQLRAISLDVDSLATAAKDALEQVASSDSGALQDSLDRGDVAATSIDFATQALRGSLVDLPGDDPAATLSYSNDTLVRRAAILTAVDAAASLSGHWEQVTAKVGEASHLTALIAEHDETVLAAAARGRAKAYAESVGILDQALLIVVAVKEQRTKLIAGTEPTVLDEWIERNGVYDAALRALYVALVESQGKVTVNVVTAQRVEGEARDRLPPDRRTIIVIVAEVTSGGLTQAVLAIEDAHGRIDEALAEAD